MDERVLETQQWLNRTYKGVPGYIPAEENGRTSGYVFNSLITALQIELGITSPVPSFGPTTKNKFKPLSKQAGEGSPKNIYYILQGSFWCKGYSPGGFTGQFLDGTERAVKEFQKDAGLSPTGVVDAKLMAVIMNTDGFRLSSQGRASVRFVQQQLNANYGHHFDYIPTDGIYERKTNKALIYALQVEIGLSAVANGNFGPTTSDQCPTLSPGNAPVKTTKVLQYALACNGEEYDTLTYDGVYNARVATAVGLFQSFMTLKNTGVADMPTIKQLLTSNGDTNRKAVACDASTIIDREKAYTLVENGYKIIGRYLTGTVGGVRSKAMTTEELEIIFDNGLRVFPIYQDGGYYAEYFVKGKGTTDANKAIQAAKKLGFPKGTAIYFAVDFDAYDYQVDSLILPYMAEVRSVFDADGSYEVGIYGARNTCIKCQNDPSVRSKYSFVSNMSTGFSGNLGFPMPTNWSFGQFYELTIGGSGDYAIGIDKNDYSGLDKGVSYTETPERKALLKELDKIVSCIPILEANPSLFTANFVFNKRTEVYRSPTVDVDVITTTNFIIPGETDVVVEVDRGKIGVSMETLFGEKAYGRLSANQKSIYSQKIDDLAISIGNGVIGMSTTVKPGQVIMTVSAYKREIPVEGGNTVKLGVTVEYTFKVNPVDPGLSPVEVEEILENVLIAAAVMTVGAVSYMAVAAIVSGGILVAGTIYSTIAFFAYLLGKDDDNNGEV